MKNQWLESRVIAAVLCSAVLAACTGGKPPGGDTVGSALGAITGAATGSSTGSSTGGSTGGTTGSTTGTSTGGTTGTSTGGTTGGGTTGGATTGGTPPPAGTVMFVTQVPVKAFLSVAAPFGAQKAGLTEAPRGGDLYIRYSDGSLRNLTAEAGYGLPSGSQDTNGIAVRQPVVHWSGNKALFSMVVGAPTHQFEVKNYLWQLYEVTGLSKGQTATITKLCQPQYNNIAPVYTSDDQVVFVSDRPRNGQDFLYPQRDEYESQPIDTGLWKLDPATCNFKLLEHVVSGVTYPAIDSFGRLIFTRWDHLQRDQQADADQFAGHDYKNGAFNYDSEDSNTLPATSSLTEFFPEYRDAHYSSADGKSIAPGYPFAGHTFNHFFPWMLNQDGSGEETVNHVGRHELGGTYTEGNFVADNNLTYIQARCSSNGSYCLAGDGGMFHLREDPTHPGRYYATVAPEFATSTSGDLVYLDGAPGTNPDSMKVIQIGESDTSGRFRNPLPLADGRLIVGHTAAKGDESSSDGTYHFRLREVQPGADPGALTLGSYLTGGINKSVDYWSPDSRVSFNGELWELDPVEVRARAVPTKTVEGALPAPEQQVLTARGVDENLLKRWLQQRSLALIVSRNVTTRDKGDLQQPYNLAITGSTTQTRGKSTGTLYNISHFQLFQADQIRGYTGSGKMLDQTPRPFTPSAGRRPLAVPLHDAASVSAMGSFFNAPLASVPLGNDGSMAAFVPAQRAMTWQMIDSTKSGLAQGIVRERNWISFKPGERRVCSSCHGVNTTDQAGNAAPQNPPQALGALLTAWKNVVRNNCPASGGTGVWTYPTAFSSCDEGEQFRVQSCQGGNGCCDGLPQSEAKACP